MKILISVISTRKHTESRLRYLKNTWLKDVENYIVLSDYDNIEEKTYKITEDSSYESNVEKNFKSFSFFYERFSDFDWFLNLDDDTFLNYKNLTKLIETLPIDEVFLLGKINPGTLPSDRTLNYCSGGAGYLFNRKTLEILKDIDSTYNKSVFADANIGFYCREKEIPLVNNELFHPTKPSYYNYDDEKIKDAISFHYIFEDDFNILYNIIKN